MTSIKNRWKLIVVLIVIGAGLAAAWVELRPSYVGRVTILVQAQTERAVQTQRVNGERYVRTQIQVLTGERVLERAARQLDGGTSVTSLRNDLQVSGGATDDTVQVFSRAPTAREAQERAGAVGAAYAQLSDGVGAVIDSQPAVIAHGPVRTTIAGGLGGLVLGVALALLVANVRPRISGWRSLDTLPVRVFPGELTQTRKGAGTKSDADALRVASWLLPVAHCGSSVVLVSIAAQVDAEQLTTRVGDALTRLGHPVEAGPRPPGTVDLGTQESQGRPTKLFGIWDTSADAVICQARAGHVVLLAKDNATRVEDVEAAVSRQGDPDRVSVVVLR